MERDSTHLILVNIAVVKRWKPLCDDDGNYRNLSANY